MASEVKANKLSPSSGTDLTLGDASDTVIVPTGATLNIVDGLGVAAGGTGLDSFTAGDVLYATGTTTLAKLAKGTAEQILSMNSGATAPEWATAAATAGGTGQTGFTAGDILYANSTTTLTKLAKGTGLQGLQTNSGATAPEWVNSPQSVMTATGDILYASGANTLAKLAKGSDTEVLTLASGVPSWAAAGGGAWTFISSTAMDAATVNVTGLDSTYNTYKLVLSEVHVDTEDGSQYMWGRVIQGGAAVTSSNYQYTATSMQSTGSSVSGYASNGNDIILLANNGTSAPTAETIDIIIDICHPASTTTWLSYFWRKIGYTHDNRQEANNGNGQVNLTAATTGMQFGLYTGAYDGGTANLYGLTNS